MEMISLKKVISFRRKEMSKNGEYALDILERKEKELSNKLNKIKKNFNSPA